MLGRGQFEVCRDVDYCLDLDVTRGGMQLENARADGATQLRAVNYPRSEREKRVVLSVIVQIDQRELLVER